MTDKQQNAGAAGDQGHPAMRDVPIGLDAAGERKEFDSMGTVMVPADRYWGAQTQRSLIHFSIGDDHMPKAVYHAYGYVKKAAAMVNAKAGRLEQWRADAIVKVADEVIAGRLDEDFPLYVWQTGSGTQSNMNVNEVISNRAIQLFGGVLGSQTPVHPNDHVNMGQSSNDSFPTAMHVATVFALTDHMLPALDRFATAIEAKANEWMDVVKTGRTHLQDAVPLTVGQEWSGYAAQVRDAMENVTRSLDHLYRLACGGTAVGTGLNAPEGFSVDIARTIAELTDKPFVTAPNKFAAQGSLDPMVAAMTAVRNVAVALMKIANDMRWLASGPRCGLGELVLPQNEPGSSIMPGKVNPTQCEAMVMVCIQVIGEDNCVGFAGSQGNFELNAMRPIIINNALHSIRIIGDMCDKMRTFSIEGTELNRKRIDETVGESLMLVTALSPVIGYDNAAHIAEAANADGSTLKEAALKSGKVDEKTFDDDGDPVRRSAPRGRGADGMIRCVRMWTGDGGDSDFEEGRIDMGEGGGADTWTPDLAASVVSFRETPKGGDYDWHRDPVPRLVLTLSGTLEFEVRDGRTFVIRPGDALLAEDDVGTGHKWRLLDDQPWRRAYVVVPDPAAVPFVADRGAGS